MSKKDNDQKKQEPSASEDPELLFDVVKDQKQAKAEEKSQEAKQTQEGDDTKKAEAAAQAEKEKAAAEQAAAIQAAVQEKEDQYLRLLAEYDNYRKRSQKEKENAWVTAKAETAKEFLPVYDNLERALKQETADEAYAKGVEMTMNQLKTVLEKLGIEEIPALGEPFNPELHDAVMHMEDETVGENTVVEVFQTGFKTGEKVIRHAMVKVAN